MPEHVGWTSLQDRCDLPPINTWGKLLLLAESDIDGVQGKWGPSDELGEREWIDVRSKFVYALAGENLHHAPRDEANHSGYLLSPAATRLRVTLTALNMPERVFQFSLSRLNDGSVSDIRADVGRPRVCSACSGRSGFWSLPGYEPAPSVPHRIHQFLEVAVHPRADHDDRERWR